MKGRSRLPAERLSSHAAPPGTGAGALGLNQRTLALSGEIDVTTDETVRDSAARCLRDEPDILIVDLRGANYCDSAGVRALRWVLRRAALTGATVCVVPPGDHFCRMLALLGADDLLAVVASAGSACPSEVPDPTAATGHTAAQPG